MGRNRRGECVRVAALCCSSHLAAERVQFTGDMAVASIADPAIETIHGLKERVGALPPQRYSAYFAQKSAAVMIGYRFANASKSLSPVTR
jgi:hypothetical protein